MTVGALRAAFPWKLVPPGTPQYMRFCLEAGEGRFWLDLADHEAVPRCTAGSIALRLSPS